MVIQQGNKTKPAILNEEVAWKYDKFLIAKSKINLLFWLEGNSSIKKLLDFLIKDFQQLYLLL